MSTKPAAAHYARLETLVAESFRGVERRTIHTHERSGAETRLLPIARPDRNQPLTRDAALTRAGEPGAALVVNTRSFRLPAASLMLDDGEIEQRVRLLRPMKAPTLPLRLMAETHWELTDRETFARALMEELAEVPVFSDSVLHLVTGLALPI